MFNNIAIFIILLLTCFNKNVQSKNFLATSNPEIRAIHSADLTPAVDIYLNGVKVLTNVTYGEASPFINSIPPGELKVDITLTGQPISQAAINASIEIATSKKYSILAIGEGSAGPTKLQGINLLKCF